MAFPGVEVSLLELDTYVPLADQFLTEGEREEYERLRHPRRRREWLGARACLKTMLLRSDCLDDPIQCAVRKDGAGRPRLEFAAGLPRGPVHDCSLTHKGRFACACVSALPGVRVGLDVERADARLPRLAAAFVGSRDQADPSLPEPVRLALLWSLKEAYSKALGVGLVLGLREVVCRQADDVEHLVQAAGGPALRGRHRVEGEYVIAVCAGAVPRSFRWFDE